MLRRSGPTSSTCQAQECRSTGERAVQTCSVACATPQRDTAPRCHVGRSAGITEQIGWHSCRHSFATILKSHGEDVKKVQELLRHANSSVTTNIYAQAVTSKAMLLLKP